jgi:hypothetical protein
MIIILILLKIFSFKKVSLASFRQLELIAINSEPILRHRSNFALNDFVKVDKKISSNSLKEPNLVKTICIKDEERIPAVEIRNVYYSYGKRKKVVNALRGINLTVPEGAM